MLPCNGDKPQAGHLLGSAWAALRAARSSIPKAAEAQVSGSQLTIKLRNQHRGQNYVPQRAQTDAKEGVEEEQIVLASASANKADCNIAA